MFFFIVLAPCTHLVTTLNIDMLHNMLEVHCCNEKFLKNDPQVICDLHIQLAQIHMWSVVAQR